jgi:hypothetical protein
LPATTDVVHIATGATTAAVPVSRSQSAHQRRTTSLVVLFRSTFQAHRSSHRLTTWYVKTYFFVVIVIIITIIISIINIISISIISIIIIIIIDNVVVVSQ